MSEVPVDIGRDAAAEAAARELARPEYLVEGPSLPERVLTWLFDRLDELFERAAAHATGGYLGLLALVVVLVLVVVAVRVVAGRPGRAVTGGGGPFDRPRQSAADHRGLADGQAAAGEWALAVRERFRAVVRELEERDLVPYRAGRTADEVAEAAGRELPECAEAMRSAARTFDEVWYGGRPATADMDQRLREVDAAVRRARPEARLGAAG